MAVENGFGIAGKDTFFFLNTNKICSIRNVLIYQLHANIKSF